MNTDFDICSSDFAMYSPVHQFRTQLDKLKVSVKYTNFPKGRFLQLGFIPHYPLNLV